MAEAQAAGAEAAPEFRAAETAPAVSVLIAECAGMAVAALMFLSRLQYFGVQNPALLIVSGSPGRAGNSLRQVGAVVLFMRIAGGRGHASPPGRYGRQGAWPLKNEKTSFMFRLCLVLGPASSAACLWQGSAVSSFPIKTGPPGLEA